ncbi:cholecystokinin receptor type a [Plakobranchus ocellatus]|uniref:Cholecystokinin receptor type a n=1 Tax=Plakobranchus ocellatus TaxID=259542 RepID=A0AAV4AW65_9GAST|nr:cholecystokinin receptor type a [Plakobranchus ocellatus]
MTPVAVFQKHIALVHTSGGHSRPGGGFNSSVGQVEGGPQVTTEVIPEAAQSGGHVRHICREIWPDVRAEQAYTLLLDLMLLVLPVVIMSMAYIRVVHVLMYDVRSSLDMAAMGNGGKFLPNQRMIELRLLDKGSCRSVSSYTSTDTSFSRSGTVTPPHALSRSGTATTPPGGKKSFRSGMHNHRIRHSNPHKIRQNKLRVIRMLFVVVLEFFVCWTPVYVLLTWMLFHQESAYQVFTPMTKTLFHLLSYVSSCCNPITYCFMNKKFREAFLRVFQCRSPPQTIRERRMQQLHQQRLQSSHYKQQQAQQLQGHRNSEFSTNVIQVQQQKRRSTAVSRLSESIKFQPNSSLSSFGAQNTPPLLRQAEEASVAVMKPRRAPAMEKCLLYSSREALDTDTPGSISDE